MYNKICKQWIQLNIRYPKHCTTSFIIALQSKTINGFETNLRRLGVPNCNQLLCDNRQNLNVDTIELIETTPGARLSQAGEETTHHLHVKQNNNNQWSIETNKAISILSISILYLLLLLLLSKIDNQDSRSRSKIQCHVFHAAYACGNNSGFRCFLKITIFYWYYMLVKFTLFLNLKSYETNEKSNETNITLYCR